MTQPSPDTTSSRGSPCSASNSLNGILRQYPGTSLFVFPILWTDLHSKLLGARFVQVPPCDTPSPECHLPPPAEADADEALLAALNALTTPRDSDVIRSCEAIEDVLVKLWPARFWTCAYLPRLHIYYGAWLYQEAVPVRVMWNYLNGPPSTKSTFKTESTQLADPDNDRPPPLLLPRNPLPREDPDSDASTSEPTPHDPIGKPMLSYIGRDQLKSMRETLFSLAADPRATYNAPVHHLLQLRLKSVIPANPDHDAVFVAIFLAMAQRHFYTCTVPPSRRHLRWWLGPGAPRRPRFEDLRLRILTHDQDTAEFIIYTGHVTTGFLERFHDPSSAPPGEGTEPDGIKIEYSRVPIWPVLGLRERLGAALGEEVVGSLDAAAKVEMWNARMDEDDVDHVEQIHDVLSEALKNSFREETDSDEDEISLPSVKRRRLPDGLPGKS